MERVRIETYRGKRLVIVDGTDIEAEQYPVVLKAGAQAVAREPLGSVLLATVVTRARYGRGAADNIRTYSAAIKPYLKASAVVGLSPMQQVIFWAIKPFAHRTVTSFGTLDEAREWLAGFGE
jgi:hypothetical protein